MFFCIPTGTLQPARDASIMNRKRQKQQTRLVFVFPAKFTAMPFSAEIEFFH